MGAPPFQCYRIPCREGKDKDIGSIFSPGEGRGRESFLCFVVVATEFSPRRVYSERENAKGGIGYDSEDYQD
jgi:hypothetical protein